MTPHSASTRLRLAMLAAVDSVLLARRMAGWRERLRMLRMAALAFLTIASRQPFVGRVVPTPRTREYELQPGPGAPVLRLRTNDLVATEVYGGRPYALDYSPLGAVQTVLDLGANAGVASAFLSARFPDARIVAVEPSPATFELLAENLGRISPGSVAVRAAVVSRAGRYRLERGTAPANDRVVAAESAPASGTEELDALTLTELLDRHLPRGVDLMKVDIEGGERELFETAAEWAPRVRAIVAEVHAPLTREVAQRELRSAGYEALPVPHRRAQREIVFCARSPFPDRAVSAS